MDRIPIWGPGNRGAVPELFGPGKAPKPISPRNPTPGTKEMLELMVQTYATDFNDRLFDNRKPATEQLWKAFDVPAVLVDGRALTWYGPSLGEAPALLTAQLSRG